MRGKLAVILLVVAVLAVGLTAGGLAYWRQGENFVTTQDAAVAADSVPVLASGSGTVTHIMVKVGARVNRGQLLAVLSVSPSAGGSLASGASTPMATPTPGSSPAGAAPTGTATATYATVPGSAPGGGASGSGVGNTSVAISGAPATTTAGGVGVTSATPATPPAGNGSTSLPSGPAPGPTTGVGVMSPSAARLVNIVAPAAGTIAAVNAVAGQTVTAGTPLFTVVRLEALRVVANISETDINRVAVGQRATITVDAEPGVAFGGTVLAVQPATLSFFSFIPTAASAGTFTKVTQRIPVTLSVSTRGYRLLPGESCEVRIRVR